MEEFLAKQSIQPHRLRWSEKVSAIEFAINSETHSESYKWNSCQEESSLLFMC